MVCSITNRSDVCLTLTLVLAVYGLAGVGGDPVPQNRRVAALQGYGQVTPLVPHSKLFFPMHNAKLTLS